MKSISLFAIAVLAALPHSARADQWNKHWSVSGKPELHVSAGDAAIVVEVGAENSIDATVITEGWTIGSSGVKISERQSGNSVQIDLTVPNTHFSMGRRSIQLRLRVPRETESDLHSGDGSIKLQGLHGNIRADTGDGSIRAEGIDGTLQAHTGDGSVHVAGRFDKLQIHTQDGSVEVDALKGSHMGSEWRLETGDGSVRVALPRDLGADVELHTGDGHIQLDLPVTQSGRQNEHSVEGKLNGGGPLLAVRTGDGSITLTSI